MSRPIMYDENNIPHKVPKELLLVKLPNIQKFETSGNPLDFDEKWKKIKIKDKEYPEKQTHWIHL